MKQAFGYTEPGSSQIGEYVRFVNVMVSPQGQHVLIMRAEDGRFVSLELPDDVRRDLAKALLEANTHPPKSGLEVA